MLTDKEIFEKLKSYRQRKLSKHFNFPQIRRVFPTLLANEIVSVQPMALPIDTISSLFNFNYKTNISGS